MTCQTPEELHCGAEWLTDLRVLGFLILLFVVLWIAVTRIMR